MTPEELVKNVSRLVSMPGVCIRVNEMVERPEHSAQDIGKLISQDPGLTARLLKIANSPFYGFSSEIETVSRAVTVLGTKQIRDLVMATLAIKTFDGIPNKLITMDNFWQHSIACGIAARFLGGQLRKGLEESLFVAGLLHDIGQLVVFNKMPDEARAALAMMQEEDIEQYQAEQRVFGFDHAQVGGELVGEWKLPPSLRACVEFHHQPTMAADFQFEACLIHIANTIAVMAELDSANEDDAPKIDPEAWQVTGLSVDVFASAIENVKEQVATVQRLFTV